MFKISVLSCVFLGLLAASAPAQTPTPPPAVVAAVLDTIEQRGDEFYQPGRDERGRYVAKNEGYYVKSPQELARGKELSVDIGYEVYDYEYEEKVDGEHIMDLAGTFHGLYGEMAWRPAPGSPGTFSFLNYYAIDARLAWAKLDYNGGVIGYDDPLVFSGSPNMVFEFRGLTGQEYFWRTGRLLPYTGLAYRFLRDDASKIEAEFTYEGITYPVTTYKRESQYLYLPVGLDVLQSLTATVRMGAKVEYDYFLWGRQDSFVFDGDVPMSMRQESGYGLRASVSLEKDFEGYSLKAEPFVRYWDIPESNVVMGYIEPDNTSREIGLRIGAAF